MLLFAPLGKGSPARNSLFRVIYLGATHDSWIMSAQFHARETKTSEKMDYLGALAIVYSTLFLSLSRNFGHRSSQVIIFLPAWRNFCVIRLGRRFLHAFIVTFIQCEIESIMVWTWSYACAWGSSHLLYGYAFTSSREVKRFSKSV